ncbi:MAG TPA: hypothetical protein VG992_03390 [Candidatus Saccharimonadales bacterium]|nr:hypothetical protein [Candidatus Saccharimonadales bacterium]
MDIKGFEKIRELLELETIDARVRPPLADTAEVKYFGIANADINTAEISGLGNLVCEQFAEVEYTGFARGYYSFVDHSLTDRV